MEDTTRRRLIQLVLLPVLYFLAAKLSVALAGLPNALVMLWIPNSLLLAAFFHYGMRGYACFAAAILAAQIVASYPVFTVVQGALFGAINLLEVTITFALLRHWRFETSVAVPMDIVKFLMAGPVIGALAAAFLAGAVYTHARAAEDAYLEVVRIWWFSDATGLLLWTPLILAVWPLARRGEAPPPLRWFDGVVAVAAVLILAAFFLADRTYFDGVQVRPVLLYPFVVYAAARLTRRAATLVTAVYATVVFFVTANGQQPFGEMPMGETVRQVQQFVLMMTLTSLGLASLLFQLRANARELEIRVERRTAELSAANEELRRLTVTDPLTGLLNRRALGNLLRREMDRSLRHRRELAVIMFDLDHFKRVNDQHGHAAGDAVLRHVAAVTVRAVRGADAVARYGGEEFVIVAPETGSGEALQLAERVREAIASSSVVFEGERLAVTASFGVTLLDAQDTDAQALIQRADTAMYAAKAAGRNRVVVDAPSSTNA